MKVIKVLGAIIGVILLVVIVLYFMGPKEVYMERSISINATPNTVYTELNSFENFNEWSPWYPKDTLAEYKIEGPKSGPDARFSWVSEALGNGDMKITESKENKMILYQMDFGYGISYARYKISKGDDGQGTTLTWTYEEEPQGISKAMYSVMDIEDVLSEDYEQGLKNFKEHVEAMPKTGAKISTVDAEPVTYIGLKVNVVPVTSANISAKMGESYGQIMGYMQESEIEMTGMPLAVYVTMGEEEIEMICGIPVGENTEVNHESIELMTLEGGPAVKAIHMGDYEKLPATYELVNTYIANNGLETAGNPYEVYVTDPGQVTDTAQWITHVYYPTKE